MTSWSDVREGDKIKVQHDRGAVIEGVYEGESPGGILKISGLTLDKTAMRVLEHTPTYRTGDIGLIHGEINGANYVGIYRDGVFYSSDGPLSSTIHILSQGGGYTIKVVGNVNEQ